MKTLPIGHIFTALDSFKFDQSKKGWKLVSDILHRGDFSPQRIVLPLPEETYLTGRQIVSRFSKIIKFAGQRQLESIRRHWYKLPAEMSLYFQIGLGTIWRDEEDKLRSPYLLCDGKNSSIEFMALTDVLDSGSELVVLGSPKCSA